MGDEGTLYDDYINILKKANEIGLPAKTIVNKLQEGPTEAIIGDVANSQINSYISCGEYTKAYTLFRKVKENNSEFELKGIIKISEATIPAKRFYFTMVDKEGFKEFAETIGLETLLSKKTTNFSEIFEFGLHPGLTLEEGDWGKCILYFDRKTGFRLNVSKVEYFNPKSLLKEKLRDLFEKEIFTSLVPYHSDHERPEGSKILGGGAYIMKDDKEIYVDSQSGDFGCMNKNLLNKCLKQEGFEGSFYGDDKYFDTTDIETYLKQILLAEGNTETEAEEEEKDSSTTYNNFEDDIPF